MKSPRSVASRSSGARFLPTPRDRLILQTIASHGRLTREHIRRLFFRRGEGGPSSPQAVNARLLKLVNAGLLRPQVVSTGHGSGPYAYGLGSGAQTLFGGTARRKHAQGSVWHQLEIASFRVRLEEELRSVNGKLVEWQGDPLLRTLFVGRRAWPVPDASVHWRLAESEGAFLLEWDRGTESLAILTHKFRRYTTYFRSQGHREVLPGLGLRPRLVVVVQTPERASRLVHWLAQHRDRSLLPTVLIGVANLVMPQPLGETWWRSDAPRSGRLVD